MLLEPEDMSLDQGFHLGNARRHNAELHGWGTVCGLRVLETHCDWEIVLRPGVAIDCMGREIRVERDVKLDVRDAVERARKAAKDQDRGRRRRQVEPSNRPHDQREEQEEDEHCDDDPIDLYVSLCYCEVPERPLQSLGGAETCCESRCENSRTRHAFRIEITHEHPEQTPRWIREFLEHVDSCKEEDLEEILCEWLTDGCWNCNDDPCKEPPCVPLARIKVMPNGHIHDIDNCCVRPIVVPTVLLMKLLAHHHDHSRRTSR
jgi:hypothetical protein